MREQFYVLQSALNIKQINKILDLVDNNSLFDATVFSKNKSIQKEGKINYYYIYSIVFVIF